MAGNDNHHVITVADPAALAKAAADRIMAGIDAHGGRVAICLAGGSSPKQLYALLATDAYRRRIDWDRIHWFIGDERFVPATDSRNNMAMARAILLDACAPAANIHPIATDAADPEEAAHRYESELKSFYGANELDCIRPLFDVVLLGSGRTVTPPRCFPAIRLLRRPNAGWSACPRRMPIRSCRASP
jgi:6-phosphogluconolactonase/glucosamine-6-phosphate isomerase/deaminase